MEDMSKKAAWWQPAITMFLKLSVWIAAPVIIALYLGKWLDKRFATEPWLFLSCIGLAFIISSFGLVKNTIKEFKKIEKDGPPARLARLDSARLAPASAKRAGVAGKNK